MYKSLFYHGFCSRFLLLNKNQIGIRWKLLFSCHQLFFLQNIQHWDSYLPILKVNKIKCTARTLVREGLSRVERHVLRRTSTWRQSVTSGGGNLVPRLDPSLDSRVEAIRHALRSFELVSIGRVESSRGASSFFSTVLSPLFVPLIRALVRPRWTHLLRSRRDRYPNFFEYAFDLNPRSLFVFPPFFGDFVFSMISKRGVFHIFF